MAEQPAMHRAPDLANILRQPFSQWARLRHPYAGWVRIGLFLVVPVALWSHDIVLLLLLALAGIGHGYWFPPHVSAGEDEPAMTRLMDKWQAWLENSAPATKALTLLPGAALILPLLYFLWEHNGFWSVYFLGFAVIYKTLFGYILLNDDGADKLLQQGDAKDGKAGKSGKAKARKRATVKRNTKKASRQQGEENEKDIDNERISGKDL